MYFTKIIQYRSASLSINPALRAGACTDCEYYRVHNSDHNYFYISTIIIFSLLTMLVLTWEEGIVTKPQVYLQ